MKIISFLLILATAIWQIHGSTTTTKSFSSVKDSTISNQNRDKTYFGKSLELNYLSQKDILVGFDLTELDPFCIQRVQLVFYTSSILLPDVYLEILDFNKWNESNVTWNNAKLASTGSKKFELSFISMGSSRVYLELPLELNSIFYSSKKNSFRLSSSSFSLFSSFFDSRESGRAPYLLIAQNSTFCAHLNETEKCIAHCKRSTICQNIPTCQSLIDGCIYEDPLIYTKSCLKNQEVTRVAKHLFNSESSIPIYTWRFYGVSNNTKDSIDNRTIIQGKKSIENGYVDLKQGYLGVRIDNLLYELPSNSSGPVGTIWYIEEDTKELIGIFTEFTKNSKKCKIQLPGTYLNLIVDGGRNCEIQDANSGGDIVTYNYKFRFENKNLKLSTYYGNVTISSREQALKYHYYEKIVGDLIIESNWDSLYSLDHLKVLDGSLTIKHPRLETLSYLLNVTGNIFIEGEVNYMLKSLQYVGGSVYIDALSSNIEKCRFFSIGGDFYVKNVKNIACGTTSINGDLTVHSENVIIFESLTQVDSIYAYSSKVSQVSFNSLKKINGNLFLSKSIASFKDLEVVNENVEILESNSIYSPNLSFVGGSSFKISLREITDLNTFNNIYFPRCNIFEMIDMPKLQKISSTFNGNIDNLLIKNVTNLISVNLGSFVNISIGGDILIQGTSLKNLEGFRFSQVTNLNIVDNLKLESLKGLSTLKYVFNDLKIVNHKLYDENSIRDLEGLERVSNFYVKLNNGREFLTIIQPCQCSKSGLFCNKPVDSSFSSQVYFIGSLVKAQSLFQPKEPQKSIYLSRALICSKNLSPKNETQINYVYNLVKRIAEEATNADLGQIAYKAVSYYNTIILGLQFHSYIPPYTSDFLINRAEKHLEFISSSSLYFEELSSRRMTIEDLNKLILQDFSDNNALVQNLQLQKKQITEQIQTQVKSLTKASDQLLKLVPILDASFAELRTEIKNQDDDTVLDFLKNCFSFALDVTLFCVTFNPAELAGAVEAFNDLTDNAIEFFDNLPNGDEDYPRFDEIFIDLNDIWPQLEKVINLISRLQKLIDANGSIESITGLIEQSEFSLVADWKSIPSKMRSSISNICTPNSEDSIAIPCQVFIDTLVTLSIYGEEISELSKSLTDLSRQSTLVISSLADYTEAQVQLKEIQAHFNSSSTAADEARLVADRHLANLVQVTVGEIQEFCLSVRYTYPGSVFDGCNIEDVYYSGGQTLIQLQDLFLRIYESQKKALTDYLTDQQEIGIDLVNITDRIPIDVLLSGKYAWFAIDRSLNLPESLTKDNFPYLEILDIVFYIDGLPSGTKIKLDYTFNSPFIKDDAKRDYQYSMSPFEDNILDYQYISGIQRCSTFCPRFDLDQFTSICICTNAQFKNEILASPTFFSRAALRIMNIQTILDTIRDNQIDPKSLQVYFTAKLKSFVEA